MGDPTYLCGERWFSFWFIPLTYKSMRHILQEQVKAEQILLWEPSLLGDTCRRTLFITAEINDEFDESTWDDPSMAERYGRLSADFDRYVSGDLIPVGLEPYDKADSAFMARIDPVEYGIWTIRSVAPKPAIRVFGAFCERDVFVALLTRKRSDLGGRGSREWANAREAAIEKWNNLFLCCDRMVGDNVNDYFSEKTIVV